MSSRVPSLIKTQRRNWALTQKELAGLIGLQTSNQISRYERLDHRPRLAVALACQVVFGVPPHKMFPKLFDTIEEDVIRQAYKLYVRLNGGTTNAARRKLKLVQDMLRRTNQRSNSTEV